MFVMGPHKKKSSKVIEREKRLARLEKKMLSGCTNQPQLAAAFGVSILTIQDMQKRIRDRWVENGKSELVEKRAQRIAQMEHLALLALDSFERSKQNSEEYTVTRRKCRECGGEGKIEERPDEYVECPDCKGDGGFEVDTTKIRGTPGDPSFLRVAKEAFLEAAKLEGLGPSTLKMGEIVKEVKGMGGEIESQVRELYFEADADLIIRAKATIEELRKSVKPDDDPKPDDDNVIDAQIVTDEPTSRNDSGNLSQSDSSGVE